MSDCPNSKELCEKVLLEEAYSFLCKDVNNPEKSSSESEEDTFFSFLHDKNVIIAGSVFEKYRRHDRHNHYFPEDNLTLDLHFFRYGKYHLRG